MNTDCYVVTSPELGWDCVVGVYFASSEDVIYEYLCIEGYGENYTPANIRSIKKFYHVHYKSIENLITKAEIRDAKIEEILKDE